MVSELAGVFSTVAANREIRAVVLRGSNGHFCSGGDITEMAGMATPAGMAADPVFSTNRRFGQLMDLVNRAPQAVITVLEGAVLGGGLGLACVSDVALAAHDAVFGMPETSLGLPPAQIAPFVAARIGLTQARRLAVLGIRIDGHEAKRLGIVHGVCASIEALDAELGVVLEQILANAPGAIAATKRLMLEAGTVSPADLSAHAARAFAHCFHGPEGREGVAAFKQKRRPKWVAD
jgi:isohexenylglutaconyl-CoA hydratase